MGCVESWFLGETCSLEAERDTHVTCWQEFETKPLWVDRAWEAQRGLFVHSGCHNKALEAGCFQQQIFISHSFGG